MKQIISKEWNVKNKIKKEINKKISYTVPNILSIAKPEEPKNIKEKK